MTDNVHNNVKNAATILLYSVANADQSIEKDEIKIIKEIVQDFFSVESQEAYDIVESAIIEFKKSTSYFKYAQITLQKSITMFR